MALYLTAPLANLHRAALSFKSKHGDHYFRSVFGWFLCQYVHFDYSHPHAHTHTYTHQISSVYLISHVVLAVHSGGSYGALGLSRRQELMFKPLEFKVRIKGDVCGCVDGWVGVDVKCPYPWTFDIWHKETLAHCTESHAKCIPSLNKLLWLVNFTKDGVTMEFILSH